MARILTITFNPAVDRTYLIDCFQRGEVNRVVRQRAVPGGKGNAVARVLRILGHDVVATGFLGGEPGRIIERGLCAEGIATAFTPIAASSRSCVAVVEQETGVISELLEPGPVVTGCEAETLRSSLPALCEGMDAVVIAGSAPCGLPDGYITEIVRLVRSTLALVAVDASGDVLRQAIAGQPHLIKPNRSELLAWMGREATIGEMIAYARAHLRKSEEGSRILLTLDADGAALIGCHKTIRAVPPPVRVVNTVGCGDALLAGYLDARLRGRRPQAALAHAVAVGSAAALEVIGGVVDPANVAALRDAVIVEPWRANALAH